MIFFMIEMIMILSISNDIFQIINKNMNIKYITLTTITNKKLYNRKKSLLIDYIINKYFNNNNYYYYYNLLNYTDFNIELLENKNNKYKLYNITNIDYYTIKNTFKNFKFKQILNINDNDIIIELIEYFDKVYNLKFNTITNNCCNNKFIEILYNEYIWYYTNINLYNIYEIYRLIKSNNKLFNKIYDDDIIINNIIINNKIKIECQKNTLLFLLNLINYFNNKIMKIYLIYNAFKYINIINIEIINNTTFIHIILNKIYDIINNIILKYHNLISKKFLNKILNLFKNIKIKLNLLL